MKKLVIIVIAVIMTVGFSSLSVAGSDKGMAVREGKHSGQFDVIYAAPEAGKVAVYIYNEARTLVHSQYVKSEHGFILPINLSGMPHGAYAIEINNGVQVQTQVFHYAPTCSNTLVNIHKLTDNRQVALTLSSALPGTSISIFDQQANLLYQEVVEQDSDFARLYDLQKIAGNSVSIEVYGQDQLLERKSIQF